MNNYGKFKLTLKREKNFVGCLIDFDVYIDNVKAGRIKNGQIIQLPIDAGVHYISIHKKNPTKVTIEGDTSADVVVFGANNFGITNINGNGFIRDNENAIKANKNCTNIVLILSILLPLISFYLLYTKDFYIPVWSHGIILGFAIVNIFGLKRFKNHDLYKSLLIKNLLSIIISIICAILISFLAI